MDEFTICNWTSSEPRPVIDTRFMYSVISLAKQDPTDTMLSCSDSFLLGSYIVEWWSAPLVFSTTLPSFQNARFGSVVYGLLFCITIWLSLLSLLLVWNRKRPRRSPKLPNKAHRNAAIVSPAPLYADTSKWLLKIISFLSKSIGADLYRLGNSFHHIHWSVPVCIGWFRGLTNRCGYAIWTYESLKQRWTD